MACVPQTIKKACVIFATLFYLSIPIVWVSLFFTTYQGDLTRIGKLPEYYFSSQIKQMPIRNELIQSTAISEANILVIGDSFSEKLIWQTALVLENAKVATILWSEIGNICEDFPEKLKQTGFKGKKIIIESIERVADKQINKSVNCSTSKPLPWHTLNQDIEFNREVKNQANLKFNLNGQFIAGLQTIYHSLAIKALEIYPSIYNFKSKGAHIYKIKNGCLYFSNELCTLGLFFHEDYSQIELNENLIHKIKKINQRLPGFQISWAIIPNKSSVYHKDTPGHFWMLLENEKLGPDLLKRFHKEKLAIKDLYAPNDSHFSNQGYLFFGNQIKNWIN